MTVPAGGSVIRTPGPTPTLTLPTQKAEVEKLYTLADVDPIGRFEGCWYGAPGTGKTVTCATLPGPFRWIDADGGLKSIRWAFKAGLTSMKDLKELVAYRPTEKYDGQYVVDPQALDKTADMLDHWFTADVANWQTLVLDSATELNLWAIYKGLHLNGKLPKKDKPLSISDSVNVQAKALLLTGEQDYKSAQGLFMGIITDLRMDCAKHGKNLILTCHEWQDTKENQDGTVTVLKIRPWLIGQLRDRIAKDFDDVWYFQIFNGKEVKVQVHGDPLHVAKTRWGQVLEPTQEPDYRKIIQKVKAFHGVK